MTISINDQEKIGIVGRTGAGKSSIGLALYRLVNLEGGVIRIGGLDIKEIGKNWYNGYDCFLFRLYQFYLI